MIARMTSEYGRLDRRGRDVRVHRLKRRRKLLPVRLLAAALIGCFAYSLVAVAVHEAVYGHKIHFHDGQICAISLHGDRHKHLDTPPATGIFISFRSVFVLRPFDAQMPHRALAVTQQARAPPIA